LVSDARHTKRGTEPGKGQNHIGTRIRKQRNPGRRLTKKGKKRGVHEHAAAAGVDGRWERHERESIGRVRGPWNPLSSLEAGRPVPRRLLRSEATPDHVEE